MKKTKVAILFISLMMIVSSFGIVSAYTDTSVPEFGTFTWSLTKSGSTVYAKTSITKYTSSTKVITQLEVQNNATGVTLFDYTKTVTGGSSSNVTASNLGSVTLAAFSCHEARGNGSVAHWEAEVF